MLNEFLSVYPAAVQERALALRSLLRAALPGIIEQVDLPAKMIAYCYGQKYEEMICTLIPSRKGLKLGFYRGAELSDPQGLLEGTGKLSRYVVISSAADVEQPALKALLEGALAAYRRRTTPK